MITEARFQTIEMCMRKVRPTNSSRSRRFIETASSTQPTKWTSKRSSHLTTPRAWPRLAVPDPVPEPNNTSLQSDTRSLNHLPKRTLPSPKSPARKRDDSEGHPVTKLNELISFCNRPVTASEMKLRKKSPKLSVSFQELKECLEMKETGEDGIGKTLKRMKRRKREEERNVTDKAMLRAFNSQRREVSNYIITRFRRQPVWKHTGVIVPRRLEDTMNQYWSELRS